MKEQNCDPRIRAAEALLKALADCESACGGFESRTAIHSTCLAGVMLILGGTLRTYDGETYVCIEHGGAELMVEVAP